MKKINIAELLKDCQKGMELDCTMFDSVKFDGIDEERFYPIRIKTGGNQYYLLTEYGQWNNSDDAKCVIFPKGKTTWEGFVPPCKFNDGDILATDLGSVFYLNTRLNTDECYGCFVGIGGDGSFHICEPFAYKECCGFATEEEKQKLFKAIKDNGYKWNSKTNTLEELVKPKFHEGDWITIDKPCQIISINDNGNYLVQYCDDEKTHLLSKDFCESHFHLWTIKDAKDGDVLTTDSVIFIFKSQDNRDCYMHCNYSVVSDNFSTSDTAIVDSMYVHPATKEQRDFLFQKMKKAGYELDVEMKTLENLPKFKVGVRIKIIHNNFQYDIKELNDTHYTLVAVEGKFKYTAPIIEDKNWELVSDKFDISTLKPFDSRVLVRDYDKDEWKPSFWGRLINNLDYNYDTVRGYYKQCIPYENNERLLGKTDDCDEYYKTWKE